MSAQTARTRGACLSAAPNIEELSEEERVGLLYQAGYLRFKYQPHQLDFYDAFEAWNDERQTPEGRQRCRDLGAQFDNLWLNEWSRRVGKTVCTLLKVHEHSTRYFNRTGLGAIGMIAIPVQKKIGGVLVPLCDDIFSDAPEGYKPEYRGSGHGLHEHLYIPATRTRIVLVGTDEHPNALRGTYLDMFAYTEAAFAKPGLYVTHVTRIKDQFQQRPHAWALYESSTPEIPDHDFNTKFKPDAQARGAYRAMVITDNTSLTPIEIEDEIRYSGGRNSDECKRELFNESEPDPDTVVIPEFDELVHVVEPCDWPTPAYALAWEGMDPGITDPFGLVGGYIHWARQTSVIQFAWMKSNASTGEVVEVTKGFERKLWGTDHATPDTRAANQPLINIAHAERTGLGKVWEAPEAALTWWDQKTWTLKPNPYARISDIANRFILDLNKDYAMAVRAAEKEPGSADADLQHLRTLFAARNENGTPKIVILRNGKTDRLIEQLRSGRWRIRDGVHKVDWERSKLLGHLDCLAALKYAARDWRFQRNPNPPEVRDPYAPNLLVPEHLMPKQAFKPAAPKLGHQRFGSKGYKPNGGGYTPR